MERENPAPFGNSFSDASRGLDIPITAIYTKGNDFGKRFTMKRKRPTITDVAAQAGVSPTTVSRVLNGRDVGHMRPETKRRVLTAIKELDYTPVKAARALRYQRTHSIGVLVPDISNPFFSLLARGVEKAAFAKGYSILICDSNHSVEKETLYLQTLLAESVEGVVFVPVGQPNHSAIDKLLRRGVNIVAADRRVPSLPTVEADNRNGSRELTRWILSLRYRKVAYIAGPEDVSTANERLDGFLEAMEEASIEPVAVLRGNFTYESGYNLTCALLSSQSKIDVLMCGNDLMAIGAISAAIERGLKVPEQLGVTGFDGIPWFKLLHPQLTTVEVPILKIGEEAMRCVAQRKRSTSAILPVELFRGHSVVPNPRSE